MSYYSTQCIHPSTESTSSKSVTETETSLSALLLSSRSHNTHTHREREREEENNKNKNKKPATIWWKTYLQKRLAILSDDVLEGICGGKIKEILLNVVVIELMAILTDHLSFSFPCL